MVGTANTDTRCDETDPPRMVGYKGSHGLTGIGSSATNLDEYSNLSTEGGMGSPLVASL